MNLAAQLLSAEDIVLDLDVSDRQALFQAIGTFSQNRHGVKASDVEVNLHARERLGSTGLGQGVAIPHARIDGLRDEVAMFVRTRAPIAFDSPDDNPVTCCFVLLVPKNATKKHLQILAAVADMLSDSVLRSQLGQVNNAADALRLFTCWS